MPAPPCGSRRYDSGVPSSEGFPMTKFVLSVRLASAAFAVSAVFAIAVLPAASPAQPPADQAKAIADKAAAFLKKSQNEDGSWSADPQNRGVTGIVVTSLIRTGTAPGD